MRKDEAIEQVIEAIADDFTFEEIFDDSNRLEVGDRPKDEPKGAVAALGRHPARRPPRSRHFSLDTGTRRVSNARSGEAGDVPDDEVNAHLGNPGSIASSGASQSSG